MDGEQMNPSGYIPGDFVVSSDGYSRGEVMEGTDGCLYISYRRTTPEKALGVWGTTQDLTDWKRKGEARQYRVGKTYGIHVYDGDRPVATFHQAEEAKLFVETMNQKFGEK